MFGNINIDSKIQNYLSFVFAGDISEKKQTPLWHNKKTCPACDKNISGGKNLHLFCSFINNNE
jgi:hypothetical protein